MRIVLPNARPALLTLAALQRRFIEGFTAGAVKG